MKVTSRNESESFLQDDRHGFTVVKRNIFGFDIPTPKSSSSGYEPLKEQFGPASQFGLEEIVVALGKLRLVYFRVSFMRKSDVYKEIIGAEFDSIQMGESLLLGNNHSVDGDLCLGLTLKG